MGMFDRLSIGMCILAGGLTGLAVGGCIAIILALVL